MNNAQAAMDPLARQHQIDPEELELLQRGTGRTSAMLLQLAVEFRRNPHRPYVVVAANEHAANDMRRLFEQVTGLNGAQYNLRFIGASNTWFNPERLELNEAYCNLNRGRPREQHAVVVIDHAVLHQLRIKALRQAREYTNHAEELTKWRPGYGN